jgi:alkanesulfonate monooxygenase SsuD/methylene tetrahydromethanopterin reductase-like flavin-dependent oxidoreductase (luciferase family)
MRFAINVPNFGDTGDPPTFLRLAREAETAGWDGLFVWDHILVGHEWGIPISDPWALLAAAAAVTERISLGPMVTPLPRRRPWVVARQAVTLDHLSGGRVLLGVGIGHPPDAEFGAFDEETDARRRAEMLDEALAILDGLWSGAPFAFAGAHYRLERMVFRPVPVQRPRIPIIVAGYWPNRAPFRRAARWDGVAPLPRDAEEGVPIAPSALREALAFVAEHRMDAAAPFEVVVAGQSPADPAETREFFDAYADAGATWWSEDVNTQRGSLDGMLELVARGPLG